MKFYNMLTALFIMMIGSAYSQGSLRNHNFCNSYYDYVVVRYRTGQSYGSFTLQKGNCSGVNGGNFTVEFVWWPQNVRIGNEYDEGMIGLQDYLVRFDGMHDPPGLVGDYGDGDGDE